MKTLYALVLSALLGAASAQITVTDARGETELDAPATRVVALEWTYAEDLLALGVQPVGVADTEGYAAWVPVEPGLDDSVTDVGTRQEPSLEAIAALEPDLIIGVSFRHEPILDALSQIAPTLLFNPYPEAGDQLEEMKTTFRQIARAVDREAQADAVLEDLEARFEAAEAQLAAADLATDEVLFVQAFTAQDVPQLRVFTDNALAIRILEELGLENAWDGPFDPYGFNTVGVEALVPHGEANFLYLVQENDDVFAGQLSTNPVWTSLPFVQEGRAYALGNTWPFGGPLSAAQLVDRVVEDLTGGQ